MDVKTAAEKTASDAKAAKIQSEVLDVVEDVLHGGDVEEARHDLSELKEKVIEHTEDLIEVNSLADDYAESQVARRLRARVNSMIAGVDTLVARLEAERRQVHPSSATGDGMQVEDLLPKQTDEQQQQPQKGRQVVFGTCSVLFQFQELHPLSFSR